MLFHCPVLFQSITIICISINNYSHLALVGFLLVVYIPHVSLQIARYTKCSVAVLAHVRLLASVSPKMSSQVSRAREDFVTELTHVLLFARSTRRQGIPHVANSPHVRIMWGYRFQETSEIGRRTRRIPDSRVQPWDLPSGNGIEPKLRLLQ